MTPSDPAGARPSPDPRSVETPIGYVDLEVARGNARRVARYAREHGLSWRPHVKTHKSRAVARIQLEAGASGLTVATLREAEVMADLTHDLLLAYPPVGRAKLERLTHLAAGGTGVPAGNGDGPTRLTVALDDPGVLASLAGACAEREVEVGVLVEMDVGLGRTGVAGPEEVAALARAADAAPGVFFRGLLFYPGHIRGREEEQAGPVAAVGERLAGTLRALEAAGHPPEVVSGGSTPTLWRSHLLPGLTEIRSGSCIYFDREAVEVGVAGPDKLAYTVLATVVSTAVPGRAVVDAGSKALAKEARAGQEGYGFVLDHPEVLVAGLSEEHGILDLSNTDWRPRVGERVRLVPNHVCVSVNLQDALLARDGEEHRWLALEGRGRGPWTD